jgi:murein L,D-transpeptidase YafK
MADKILVLKSERLLMLLKEGEILRCYRVSLGGSPVGRKERLGDRKTPEGVYLVDWRNPHSRFHRALHISYPNEEDLRTAKVRGVEPGSDIMIHGLPKGFDDLRDLDKRIDWTQGCIALTNAEIDEVWEMVADGTPVEIRP